MRLVSRFPERQAQIEQLGETDAKFREVCLDYEEVVQATEYWRRSSSPALVDKIDECEKMLQALENEALQRLQEKDAETYHEQHYATDEPKMNADGSLINDPLLDHEPEILLAQPAAGGQLNEDLQWFNEPATWWIEDNTIVVKPDAITDFWQRTHYGFQNDNGHFLYLETDKDFVMQTHSRFKPVHQFDQCGLMVRLDQDNWLKTSIEYQLENPASMGAVVTNLGYSDWSIQSVADQIDEAWYRIERDGRDFVIDTSLDGELWEHIRVCRLHHANGIVKCGLYCCSPIGGGYEVLFDQLEVRELII